MIGTVMAESLGSLFTEDDDEFDPTAPDKIKDFDKLFGQALFSAFTSLTLGRDFGNATKAIVNYGVEEFNESQLEFLRDGEYDEFRDANLALPDISDPQKLGSCITYYRRYTLVGLLALEALDDDGNAAAGNTKFNTAVCTP